jgi:hypothetical protein
VSARRRQAVPSVRSDWGDWLVAAVAILAVAAAAWVVAHGGQP